MTDEDLRRISAPWNSHDWAGAVESVDGTETSPTVAVEDVAIVLAYGSTPKDWDGEEAMVLQLMDGRFVSWESTWGPTGSGFCCDAYGGDAVVWFSADAKAATSRMSEKALDLIRDQIKEYL